MSELNPCPFCGYKLSYEEGICKMQISPDTNETLSPTGVCCPSCGAYQVGGETVEQAITAWNTRVTPTGTITLPAEPNGKEIYLWYPDNGSGPMSDESLCDVYARLEHFAKPSTGTIITAGRVTWPENGKQYLYRDYDKGKLKLDVWNDRMPIHYRIGCTYWDIPEGMFQLSSNGSKRWYRTIVFIVVTKLYPVLIMELVVTNMMAALANADHQIPKPPETAP